MESYKYLITILSFVFSIFIFSCADDKVTVEYIQTSDSGLDKILFTATVSDISTRSGISALVKDRFVVVYSFDGNKQYVQTNNYYTYQPGILSAINNDALIVPNGIYNFYMFSIGNKSEYPPSFSNTVFLENLSNGYDYLSYSLQSISIKTSTNIPILFSHCCSQVVIDFESSKDTDGNEIVSIDSVRNITITPPNTAGVGWDMYTGQISYSNSINNIDLIDMPVNKLTCQQVLLPLNTKDSLTVKFELFVDNSTAGKYYTAKLPLVDDKLAAGSSYNYVISISDTDYPFTYLVNIYNWRIVDETGKPLVPTLKLN